MKVFIDKNIGTLVHIYDYLNGGYFSTHNQLQFFSEKAYQLYLGNDKNELLKLYNKLKDNVSAFILSTIENSPGIRYFCCDSCHDAKINDVYIDKDCVIIILDTSNMLGCLDIEKTCIIKIKTDTNISCRELIDDVKTFKKVYWISSDIIFNLDTISFELEVQANTNKNYQNIKYEFIITDIEIN